MISDSVELWDSVVCVLHIQLSGTNVRLPKIHKIPPEVDFESSRSPAKSESWNRPNRHCFAMFPTFTCVMNMYEIKRDERLSHAFVHVVTDRASLFTEHRTSDLPIRAKYKHFKTICEQTSEILQLIQVLFLDMMIIQART